MSNLGIFKNQISIGIGVETSAHKSPKTGENLNQKKSERVNVNI